MHDFNCILHHPLTMAALAVRSRWLFAFTAGLEARSYITSGGAAAA